MPANELRRTPESTFPHRKTARLTQLQSLHLVKRDSLLCDRKEMRDTFDKSAIDPLKALDRQPHRAGDLAMLPCAAESITHQPPVAFAAGKAGIVDDRQQAERFPRRNIFPILFGMGTMQDQGKDAARPKMFGTSAFGRFLECLEQDCRDVEKLIPDRCGQMIGIGAQHHDRASCGRRWQPFGRGWPVTSCTRSTKARTSGLIVAGMKPPVRGRSSSHS